VPACRAGFSLNLLLSTPEKRLKYTQSTSLILNIKQDALLLPTENASYIYVFVCTMGAFIAGLWFCYAIFGWFESFVSLFSVSPIHYSSANQ
jgi:hypothetical protein